jgi:NitT/TauT family transport system ATP-binding protein
MIIELRNASASYQAPDGEVEALRDVSFAVEEGEFCSIVGPSGCGKSTLLGVIAGLEPPAAGSVLVDGRPVTGPTSRIGFMPQRDQLFEWRSIWDNVTLGLTVQGRNTARERERVRELLERYGLADFARKRPGQLSGGMRQRCALIRTLATDPRILLLDEPFSALDYQTRLNVSSDIYRIIREQGKTALLVTHDISEAISLSDRIVVLSRRPAAVKDIWSTGTLKALPPLERREDPAFAGLFNHIWKELELHE